MRHVPALVVAAAALVLPHGIAAQTDVDPSTARNLVTGPTTLCPMPIVRSIGPVAPMAVVTPDSTVDQRMPVVVPRCSNPLDQQRQLSDRSSGFRVVPPGRVVRPVPRDTTKLKKEMPARANDRIPD